MDALIKKLNIDTKFTKAVKKQKVFNHVKNNIPPVKGYNYMCDLLQLPVTAKKNGYLFVVVDLADNSFDIEPLQNKTAENVLSAFKTMIKRPYIKLPKASIRSDNGGEFMGVFHKFLYDNNILHKVGLAGRHKQTANVENLNKTLGGLFNGYMNGKEIQTKKQYNNWDDIVGIVRKDLNEIRTIKLEPLEDYAKESIQNMPDYKPKPLYKVGDVVHYKLDTPQNALGHKQPTEKFREGDYRWSVVPKKIVKVIYMTDNPYYRYLLEGMDNVSYSENELMPSKKAETEYVIDRALNVKTEKKKKYYLIKWKGWTKAQSTWEPETSLLADLGKQQFDLLISRMTKKK